MWYTYLLPDYEELDASGIRLDKGTSIEIECSFTPIVIGSPDATHEVILQIVSDGNVYSAADQVSNVTRFSRRWH